MEKSRPFPLPITSSAETIANIQDLLIEILKRIPTKPLLKLKLISKQWFSLISSPQFCLLHHQDQDSLAPKGIFLVPPIDYKEPFELPVIGLNPGFKPPVVDFIHDTPHSKLTIVQSCNGLLLGNFSARPDEYFVCNPIIRRFKKVYFPDSRLGDLIGLNLAFDPIKSSYYNIISVSHSKESGFCICIYSSKSDDWDASCISFEPDRDIHFWDGVFCNGIFHWDCSLSCDKSLMLDLENRALKEMPMLADTGKLSIRYFGESRGYLHIGFTYAWFEFDVFEMATDYSHWFLKCRVDLNTRIGTIPPFYCIRFRVLSVIRFESEMLKIVISADFRVICGELKDGTLTNLYELNEYRWTNHLENLDDHTSYLHDRNPSYYDDTHIYNYFETLTGSNP